MTEILDIFVMTFFVGFIFKDMFKMPARMAYESDPVKFYNMQTKAFNWNDLLFAAAIVAPAIILHEFGHKFTAMFYGFTAEFHAAYFWLALGVFLKLMNFGMIFFVPAFVSFSGYATPFQLSIVAFAGPAVNLILWLGTKYALKAGWVRKKKWIIIIGLTSKINMFLFFFNMIPIPPFDGYHVFSGLIKLL